MQNSFCSEQIKNNNNNKYLSIRPSLTEHYLSVRSCWNPRLLLVPHAPSHSRSPPTQQALSTVQEGLLYESLQNFLSGTFVRELQLEAVAQSVAEVICKIAK